MSLSEEPVFRWFERHRASREYSSSAPLLPEQFAGIWSTSHSRTGEQRLALAVLERTIFDLRTLRFARSRKEQRLYLEAYQWVESDDPSWTFSFVGVCRTLAIEPAALRETLLDTTRTFAKAA